MVKDVIIPNVIWISLLSIPSAVVGIKYTINLLGKYLQESIVVGGDLIIALVCIAICLLALISNIINICYNVFYKKQVPQFPKLETDYVVEESEFEMFFKDREHLVMRQRIKYKVVAESLEAIPHAMQWTGSNYLGSKLTQDSIQRGYRLNEQKMSASIYNLVIKFPEVREHGFVDTYEILTEVEDKNCNMMPVLARLIKCQTKILTLRITVPENLIEKCIRFISADIPAHIMLSPPVDVRPKHVGDALSYEHTFTELDLLHYYFLEWTFVDNGKQAL